MTTPRQTVADLNPPELLRQLGIAVGMSPGQREAFVARVRGELDPSAEEKQKRRRNVPGVAQTERELQDECETWLREHSGIPSKWIRPRMDRASGLPIGWPDFTIMTTDKFGRGIVVLIECKRADVGSLDPEQIRMAGELAAVGHKVHVARSLAEFGEAVRAEIER